MLINKWAFHSFLISRETDSFRDQKMVNSVAKELLLKNLVQTDSWLWTELGAEAEPAQPAAAPLHCLFYLLGK